MEFKDNEAIYLQIAAYVCDNILMNKWPPEQKIPSVRDLAVELEVNPNTVMRSYEFLQKQEVVYNKRGLGLFVAPDGYERVKSLRRENFMQQNLPELFKNMYLLDISADEIIKRFSQYKSENYGQTANENEDKE
ncbi:GntR family transcriptional regulator [Mucilaginibacter sp. L3T2-6]|uniref:GntR family transcriptional regulator n=1 Tax=Mucilaginibacter sp. L3T2-6 TaxID=3062491 RepID=UPI00267459F8|nr:GntR family transcriptional regulator [Mucilaginibacter sp. L3T2-6]MDO3645184.1 GntR family transcriptional regulator [Mucilaginibacter sp. L3T2-6]MDV6217616.1 GntR family transcriptional regulator [Mucilaginibacter sp. L3T2-6]